MINKKQIYPPFVALALSIALNFNRGSLSFFLITSLIGFLVLWIALASLLKAISLFKEGRRGNGILHVAKGAVPLIIAYVFLASSSTLCPSMVQDDHYRTNIITRQCSYGGAALCLIGDPWYYKSGCKNTKAKIGALKKTGNYEKKVKRCDELCQKGHSESWGASPVFNEEEYLSCDELADCDSI